MAAATRKVRRQLHEADGVVRWTTLVGGPREFWTVSAWRSRHAMQEFMRSDAHNEVMWSMSRWLQSFWIMRWRPVPSEVGTWRGLSLGVGAGEPADTPVPRPPRAEAVSLPPALAEAMGPSGAPTYASSPEARRRRQRLQKLAAAVVRIETTPARLAPAWHELAALRRLHRTRGRLLRSALGIDRREVCLLTVWEGAEAAVDLVCGDACRSLTRSWGEGCWASVWLAEHEFGQWDGLRFRLPRPGIHQVPGSSRQV